MRNVRTIIQPNQFNSNLSQSKFGLGNPFKLDEKSQPKKNLFQKYIKNQKVSSLSKTISFPFKSAYAKVHKFVSQNLNNLATIFDKETSDFAGIQNFVHVLELRSQIYEINKTKLEQMKTVISQIYGSQYNLLSETDHDSQMSEIIEKRFTKSMKVSQNSKQTQ